MQEKYEALIGRKFTCYGETAAVRLNTAEAISRHLRAAFAPSKTAVTNLLFIAKR